MKGFKISIERARELAVHLFEMEIESLGNDPEFHFEFNEWNDKYGESSIKFEKKITSDENNPHNAVYIEKIAQALKEDFASGFWVPTKEDIKEDSLYQIYMDEEYGGWITKAFEMQLADLTGVGFQSELNLT